METRRIKIVEDTIGIKDDLDKLNETIKLINCLSKQIFEQKNKLDNIDGKIVEDNQEIYIIKENGKKLFAQYEKYISRISEIVDNLQLIKYNVFKRIKLKREKNELNVLANSIFCQIMINKSNLSKIEDEINNLDYQKKVVYPGNLKNHIKTLVDTVNKYNELLDEIEIKTGVSIERERANNFVSIMNDGTIVTTDARLGLIIFETHEGRDINQIQYE